MFYISEIALDGKSVDSVSFQSNSLDLSCIIKVSDFTGNSFVSCAGDLQESEIYGLECMGWQKGRFVAVRHDLKSAMLYSHICQISRSAIGVGFSVADRVMFSGLGYPFLNLDNSDRLQINTGQSKVELFGSAGSVSSLRIRGSLSYVTLYDIFRFLYRESGLNIMRYNAIQLYSSYYSNLAYVIQLKHDNAAERFFTKMLMDVMRA